MSYCDTCTLSKCPVDKSGLCIITFCGHKKSIHKKLVVDTSQAKLLYFEDGD